MHDVLVVLVNFGPKMTTCLIFGGQTLSSILLLRIYRFTDFDSQIHRGQNSYLLLRFYSGGPVQELRDLIIGVLYCILLYLSNSHSVKTDCFSASQCTSLNSNESTKIGKGVTEEYKDNHDNCLLLRPSSNIF